MSMLSSQCDELRTLADKLRDVRLNDQVNYVESVETMFRAMGAMREAADTIISLRDRLQAAEMGSGTCEVNGTNFWEWEWSDYTAYYEHELSCGHVVTTMEPEPPNFCEECGSRIRKAVER